MNAYVLVLLSDIFLAINAVLSKVYQKRVGVGLSVGLKYNLWVNFFTVILFVFICKFQIKITFFSLFMAVIMPLIAITHSIMGFYLLKYSNVSYTTLLSSCGGIIVPYLYGIIFLNETLSALRVIGIMLIIFSMFVSNIKDCQIANKHTVLSVLFTVFNGLVGVITKVHQVTLNYKTVDSSQYVFLSASAKVVICAIALLFIKQNQQQNSFNLKKQLPLFILTAIICGMAYLFQLVGASRIPATVLFPLLTGGTIILSTITSKIILKENVSMRQWIAVGVCFIGTCMFL